MHGSDGYAFVATVAVRWSDVDVTGHLAPARLVTAMEEARVAWLLSAGDEYRPLITSAMIVSVELSTDRRLTYDDGPLRIAMWIEGFRSVDFTIAYAVHSSRDAPDAPAAYTARTQMAVVDVAAHTLRRLTDEEKGHLRAWSRPST
ncbi:acyl-CoA thioesterase [Williamsia deligens]|uniref:Acyl-CoA thioesterase n=1 Tax=Williamsia deligens TaxID=321325 RepID=A0ABW3G582_9NOCA|nr:acyl-CoA thioesterase [Williamsia deligens]MCP2193514.1 acyl-CoA thioester hydrolase [Williamsia deligens]